MTTAIETTQLTRRYGRLDAVDGLDLEVPAGSVFALIGPNGAGKTTTIKLLMNLVQASRGRATVLGVDSRRLGVRDFQRIGYVSENQKLPDWMTASELLEYCRTLYPTWDEAFRQKLQRDLDLTSGAPLRKLSRGMRMKAALLASLAYRPELIVLDEPFTGLDPLVREELIRAMLELPDDTPRTVFIASHDIEEVERLADWIGFITNGRLRFAEPVSSLQSRFRLVEVVAAGDTVPAIPARNGWIPAGAAGRTARFIDTAHSGAPSEERIATTFPEAEIRTSAMPLRDIFVCLARTHRAEAQP
jgi:ABC-2 type transport system ATP-binding protein